MLLDTLLKNIKSITNNSVIKINNIAKSYETLESTKASDEYLMAINKKDKFTSYTEFEFEALANINVIRNLYTDEQIQMLASNPSEIDMIYRDLILENQRNLIIQNYDETNIYYRSLNGIPKDESEFITISNAQRLEAEIISDATYIHELDSLNIYKLDTAGILKTIKDSNPTFKYLNYLGDKKISIVSARSASNFSIIYLKKEDDVADYFYDSFIRMYNQCREYFMTVIYNSEYSSSYYLYDNFIGLCIMMMTIQRIISLTFKNGIEREFFDWEFIQNMYKTYNIPFIKTLPIDYHITILKNLNNLLRYKSTDKVLIDICSLLGYEELEIYRYYMVRQQKMDSDEKPLFYYKDDETETLTPDGTVTEFILTKEFLSIKSVTINGVETENYLYDPSTSKLTFINNIIPSVNDVIIVTDGEKHIDYEQTFDVYFQAVNIKDKNIITAMQNTTNKFDYSIITTNDPYWWEDDNVEKIKYGIGTENNGDTFDMGYNYVKTKYMGLNLMYKMTDMIFEVTYAFNAILDKDNELTNININLPKVYQEDSFPLFDTVVYLIALVCKLNGFVGGVITRPSIITNIYSNIDEDTKMYGFNFDATDVEYIKSIITDNADILNKKDPTISAELLSYFENLTITSDNTIDNIYSKIKKYNSFIITKMRNAQSIKEYKIYKTIFHISMLSDIQSNTFSYQYQNDNNETETAVATTYMEYLQHVQPILYNSVNDTEQENVSTLIDHVIAQIEIIMSSLQYTFFINGANNPIFTAITSLLNFFKSYTTDITMMNIIYLFNSKYYNMLKMIEDIKSINKTREFDDSLHGLYSDILTRHTDLNNLSDSLFNNDSCRLISHHES